MESRRKLNVLQLREEDIAADFDDDDNFDDDLSDSGQNRRVIGESDSDHEDEAEAFDTNPDDCKI